MIAAPALSTGSYGRLLSHRPYRFYFISSSVGAFASTVEFLGLGWMILHVMPPAWGIAMFLVLRLGVKSLCAAPAGLLADRYSRQTIYAWMRVATGVAALIGALAAASGSMHIAIAAITLSSMAHAVDLPAHRALMAEVQPDDMLERAISFGSGGFHVAALAAPIIAMPLATELGASAPLLVASLAFFAAAIAAFRIQVEGHVPDDGIRHESHGGAILTALRFVWKTPLVALLLLAAALPSVIDKTMAVMLPSASGAEHALFGFVLAAPELGAIALGFAMAALRWRFAGWIPLASGGIYVCGIATASCAGIGLGAVAVMAALFVAGCAKTALISSALAGIQRNVPPHLRGRIMTV